jgi:2-oxoglutarate ferredoxin oxidoreductase subunit beta
MVTVTATINDYTSAIKPTWCPGCGNFGILTALKRALVELDLKPHQVLLVSDIGQNGKLPHYTKGNVFNSLHGRAVPPSIGAKIANRNLNVIVSIGDGGCYGEGANHFIHAARRNHDITVLVHDNQVYGLTKGQTSPTSDMGFVTKSTPEGSPQPVNPLSLALSVNAGFIARAFSDDIDFLVSVIKSAITHRGFSLVDILQPCVSFNHKNTHQWYKERVYHLESDYNAKDKLAAFRRAQEWGEKIPTGIFYDVAQPVYEDTVATLDVHSPLDEPLKSGKLDSLIMQYI